MRGRRGGRLRLGVGRRGGLGRVLGKELGRSFGRSGLPFEGQFALPLALASPLGLAPEMPGMGAYQRALDLAPIMQMVRAVGGTAMRDDGPEVGGEVDRHRLRSAQLLLAPGREHVAALLAVAPKKQANGLTFQSFSARRAGFESCLVCILRLRRDSPVGVPSGCRGAQCSCSPCPRRRPQCIQVEHKVETSRLVQLANVS